MSDEDGENTAKFLFALDQLLSSCKTYCVKKTGRSGFAVVEQAV